MNRNQISQLAFDCVLPSSIFFNEDLEPNCIKLYAMVRNLAKMHGYCFATNEYLATLLSSDVSSIKRWLVSLKKEGYLEIQTNKTGIHWSRELYLSDKFKICLRRLKNELPPAQNCAPPSSEMSHIKEEYSKEEYKKENTPIPSKEGSVGISLPGHRREFGTNPRALGINPRERKTNPGRKMDKKEVASFVMVTDVQHSELLKKANGSEELVKKWYDFLSTWKIGKSIGQRPNDFAAILRWVIKAVEEDLAKPKPVDMTEANKKLAEEIKARFPNNRDIDLGYNYIEFRLHVMGKPDAHLKFSDHGFREQVEHNLRRLELRI